MSQTKAQLIDPVDLSIVTADLADDAVTAPKLSSNAVVNASVDASAAIAGTKISPNFGSQAVSTTGDLTIDTNTLHVDASNNFVGIGTASPSGGKLHISHSNELGIYTLGGYNYQAKFESSDAEAAIVIEDNGSTNDGNRIGVISDDMAFTTANSERFRVDSSGRFLLGKTATKASDGENTAKAQIESTGNCMLDIAANGTTSSSYAGLNLIRSDGSSVNDHTAVDSGDRIARINFIGADGSDRFNSCARIAAFAAADFSANNCPGILTFETNSGGAAASERMRIDKDGRILIGTSTAVGTNTPVLQVKAASPATGFDNHVYLEGNETNGNADTGGAIGFGGHDGTTARNWAQICGFKTNGSSGNTSSFLSFRTRRSGVSGINEMWKITAMGSLLARDNKESAIGREFTNGSVPAGQTRDHTDNGRLNFNSIGGNGGGHITCLSVSSVDQNPSGAMIIAGVHGQGFNSYDTILSNFDSI